ncbi:hypothetical protein DFQ28_003630 [Apophysomyces sp. BC1034]|nr:hypothetical protein DFQ28_003630 [Apophysomyces sp. BC1034]
MVYYQEPDLDQRNWGNLNDKGIYMAQTGRDESETLAHGRQYESIDEIQGRAAAALIRCLTQNALNTFYERQGAQEVARCVTETAKAWAADIKKDLQRQPHEEDEQMTLFIPTDKRLWRKKAEVFVDMKKVSVNIPRAMTVKRKQRTENEAESAPTNVSGDKEEEKQKFKDEFPVIPCIILTPRQEKIKKKVEEQRQAKEEELSLQSTKQKRQKRLRMK